MKIKLQATGYAPFEVEPSKTYSATEMLEGDKRGVRLTVLKVGSVWIAEVSYLTTWGSERPFSWVLTRDTLAEHDQGYILNVGRVGGSIATSIRGLAKSILPPGAGFPATPPFETRQAKLNGSLETATLTALSTILAVAHEDGELYKAST